MRLSILSKSRPRRRQALRLTVIVPAAQLRQPEPQTITAKVLFPWDTAKERRTLPLKETGLKSWVGTVQTIPGSGHGGRLRRVAPGHRARRGLARGNENR